ncbi:MAG: hypothetical protein DRI89_08170 [Bacteroidetes bacterium]|nr:MAG: hypothetical protein DRI89_08170 [Bacteroidota bacterium]
MIIMKKLLLLVLLTTTIAASAQKVGDTIHAGNWLISGQLSLNLSQSYFSNWAAGGSSNLTTIGKYTMSADYAKDRHSWNNWLDLALGYSFFQNVSPMISEDKIEYITSYNYELKKPWYFSVVGKFATQFAKGYDYEVDSTVNFLSKFMAPAYFDIGPGIKYEPTDWFFVNFSPATASWVYVGDQRLANNGAFGLTPAERDANGDVIENASKLRTMFGAKLMAVLQYEIVKNVHLGTKLELFSNYLENPQNIIVNWQVLLGFTVNGWLNIDLQTTLLYDDKIMITDKDGNIGPRVQFREILMLSVNFSF